MPTINILYLSMAVWILFIQSIELTQPVIKGFYSYFEPRFKVNLWRADA